MESGSEGVKAHIAATRLIVVSGMSGSGGTANPGSSIWVQPSPRRASGMSEAENRPRELKPICGS